MIHRPLPLLPAPATTPIPVLNDEGADSAHAALRRFGLRSPRLSGAPSARPRQPAEGGGQSARGGAPGRGLAHARRLARRDGRRLAPRDGEPVSLGVGPLGQAGEAGALAARRGRLGGGAEALRFRRPDGRGARDAGQRRARLRGDHRQGEASFSAGDPQYHLENAHCLERFVERMNARDDIAWIALIGDVCDNAVRGRDEPPAARVGRQAGACPLTTR